MAGRMKLGCMACVVAALAGACSSSSESVASTAASIASTDSAAPATQAPQPTSIETSVESTTPATTTSEPVTASTTAPSDAPSTTADPRPINVADQALASAGLLQAADFSSAWVQYSPGGASTPDPASCGYRPNGALSLVTNGGGQFGPTMQLGSTGAFTSSSSLAFPDEAAAIDYVIVVNSDDWATCRAQEFQKFQTDNGSDIVVTVGTRDEPSLHQNGFESYAQFNLNGPDGVLQRYVLISLYRLGREVVTVNEEYANLSDADFKTFTDENYAALVAAYGRINALV